ncbi:phosphate acetyltransferase [Candidatus Competibacter denitrificans Run_A_D11]|uniref:Phosphate acetyltransferase n=1 Tax=Candidatus Competibacter denitrificans Run_A_D11 TaxID=1400863 RepID=W6M256_9GAMM|nr:phosphate acetyltransferase [Candidatus Competibacter denitrificans]CDI01551.1 phosphate acetyltransferase [Candidatus Competibacter denitrificans Run_A_D11]HAS87033.1 phosphate acetyltransferase [Candidatus Competibacteraceae bacterium]HRC70243.1 phosphate acetyltransferase [Candidatus Competibacter denitrificans]
MQIFYLVPTRQSVGLTSIALGLVRALQHQGFRVGFTKPVAEDQLTNEHSAHFAREICLIEAPDPIPISQADERLTAGLESELLEEIVGLCMRAAEGNDVLVAEGMHTDAIYPFTPRLNAEIARSLKAEIVLVASAKQGNVLDEISHMAQRMSKVGCHIAGAIINKAPPSFEVEVTREALGDITLWGVVPYDASLLAPRTLDIARHLNARVLAEGEIATRRVLETVITARSAAEMIHRLTPGALIMVAGDRDDVMLATALAASNGVQLAGLILTHGSEIDPRVRKLAAHAFSGGLPILSVATDSFATATRIDHLPGAVPTDDIARMNTVLDAVADQLWASVLTDSVRMPASIQMSPPAFRYRLIQTARMANQRIVLPEGDEPRTIRAAVICTEKEIARCVLLGKRAVIEAVAAAQGVVLPPTLEIIDPDDIREQYVEPLVEMRRSKGLTPAQARDQLQDTVVLGTMMLAMDTVDGLVSGAVHTTASTVRPALQLIKTEPGSSIVSSVFFMLMPDQVLVYGDCAINPDPTAAELAEIALQSAASARAFGIEPKVAMISYSTGSSGTGADVEKVRQATELARTKAPDLAIDGPLQYDAASVREVGQQKAPGSKVAGEATVFVFPDLNTGNTTYKAVQRSANVISLGPMLQGLNKPVNDLSRGALVDDIVFTIALTAIQARARGA